MIITVASGKGGTGKTTLAVALAQAAGKRVQILDCDVEEPNVALFLKPEVEKCVPVENIIPSLIPDKCNHCGNCAQICQYHAIVMLREKPLIFPDLCHSCGGCFRVCPTGALKKTPRRIGEISLGYAGHISFVEGRMIVGEALAPPIIRKVFSYMDNGVTVVVDAPPGSSCPAVEAISRADFVLFVVESTPFGVHDFLMVADIAREMKKPVGVILNKVAFSNDDAYLACKEKGIPVMLEIPLDKNIAVASSHGDGILIARPQLRDKLKKILHNIEELTS